MSVHVSRDKLGFTVDNFFQIETNNKNIDDDEGDGEYWRTWAESAATVAKWLVSVIAGRLLNDQRENIYAPCVQQWSSAVEVAKKRNKTKGTRDTKRSWNRAG